MKHLLALDQGTTSSRAILFQETGQIVATSQREFPQIFPQSGWVEHDPLEIWSSQIAVAEEALESARLQPSDVAAIGITNQRETTVVWDRESGKPIYNAIVWQDRRTADFCKRLKSDGCEELIRCKTGLLLDPYFSATKIAWILEHVPGARRAAEAGKLAFGTIDTWLVYQLTRGQTHVTDVSNAARTMLLDIHRVDWDDELLKLFNIPRSMLPEVRSSSEIYAHVDASMPLPKIAIAGIAGDQQAALFGQACFQPGQTKNTYGTGCFTLLHTGDKVVASRNRLLSTIAWKIGDQVEYALEGSVFVGGAVVGWLRDGLGVIGSSSEIESLANSVPDSGDVYLVPAFTGLGAPHWDPYARGAIVGLTRGTTAAHIARAAMESIAFQVADLMEAMGSDAAEPITDLRADGGAAVNNSLLQFQADILQLPVVRPTVTETTALGAAYLAGLAVGVWKDRDDLADQWQVDRRFEPKMSPKQAAERRARWSEAVERSKGWAPAGE